MKKWHLIIAIALPLIGFLVGLLIAGKGKTVGLNTKYWRLIMTWHEIAKNTQIIADWDWGRVDTVSRHDGSTAFIDSSTRLCDIQPRSFDVDSFLPIDVGNKEVKIPFKAGIEYVGWVDNFYIWTEPMPEPERIGVQSEPKLRLFGEMGIFVDQEKCVYGTVGGGLRLFKHYEIYGGAETDRDFNVKLRAGLTIRT